MEGVLRTRSRIRTCRAGTVQEVEEIGSGPRTRPVDELGPGEVGYLISGIKDVGQARSG